MNTWIFNSLAIFTVSAMLTGFVIPQLLLICGRRPEPGRAGRGGCRLGGIAFLPAGLLALALVAGLNVLAGKPELGMQAAAMQPEPWLFGICVLLMLYVAGLADDLFGLRRSAMRNVRVGAALLAGVTCAPTLAPAETSWPVAAIVGAAGMMLLTGAARGADSRDGIAAGVCVLVMAVYGVMLAVAGAWLDAMVAFCGVGCLLPFVYYNLMGHLALGRRIRMGASGSQTVAGVIGLLSLRLWGAETVGGGACADVAHVMALTAVVLAAAWTVTAAVTRMRRRPDAVRLQPVRVDDDAARRGRRV